MDDALVVVDAEAVVHITSEVELDKVERSVVAGALLVIDSVLDVGEVEELTPEGLTVEEAAVGEDVEVWFYS